MYQLIQILFQNFFSILCTNRSPSPFDFHSSETSADPHHVTDTPHQATLAPPHIRKYVPTPPSALPYHRTTAPHSQLYSQPYHRTTVPPHLSPALQTHHCKYNIPHSQTYHHAAPPHRTPRHTLTPPRPHPHHIIPPPCSHTIPTPAGRPDTASDAVSTPHRRRPRREPARASPPARRRR